MLTEDFKKSDDYPLMLFIGKHYLSMEARFINNGNDFVCTHREIQLEPIKWFKLLIYYFGFTADSLNGDENKIAFLAQARSNTIQLVENLYEMMDEIKSCKRYDFSGVVRKVDALIQLGKTELEAKLLVSQIGTNENTVTTNRNISETNLNIQDTNTNIRRSNTIMQKILWLTFFITVVGAGITAMNLKHEYEKDFSERTIKQKDTTIQSLQVQLSQTLKDKDSLKLALYHYLHKTLDTGSHGSDLAL